MLAFLCRERQAGRWSCGGELKHVLRASFVLSVGMGCELIDLPL